MILLCLSLLFSLGALPSRVQSASSIPAHLKEEGHRIAKRFADHHKHHFQGHDIADVFHKTHPPTFHHVHARDLSNVLHQDSTQIRLDMRASRESLVMNLKKRAIVDIGTEFITHTKDGGRVKRAVNVTKDCFATGHLQENPNSTKAAVSLCNGLHGVVNRNGVDYYIHPVEQEADGGRHQVHILWKRNTESGYSGDTTSGILSSTTNLVDAWKTSSGFVIEMALFTDAAGWKILQELVPGREDEYLLVGVAAANALYGDKDEVGYNADFKVKLVEYWVDDPEEYEYNDHDTLKNLNSYCEYTRNKYANPEYDMHIMQTGVSSDGNIAGRAYSSGVCRPLRCVAMRTFSPNRYDILAHEIGHNLGFRHHSSSNCPAHLKALTGGFMGGGIGEGYNRFSPCNKWELHDLFSREKGSCLFKEIIGAVLPKVFPGESQSPDKQCELYAGFGYKYFRPYELFENGMCKMFLCVNANVSSPGYRSIKRIWYQGDGFPCGDEMLCIGGECEMWSQGSANLSNIQYLRNLKTLHQWASWPGSWSECSSTCGNGVQTKERECMIDEGPFVSPYCAGSDNIKARLCAQTPCDGEPTTDNELRKHRSDKMCADLLTNGVKLLNGEDYQPLSQELSTMKYYFSTSCLVSCVRTEHDEVHIDGLLPSGTPCTEKTRDNYDLDRLNIEMRCVNGKCMEFSDCPDNGAKDKCGACMNAAGYDAAKCVYKTISVVAEGDPEPLRVFLTSIPAGTTHLSVQAKQTSNGRLELWSSDESVKIWGREDGGLFDDLYYLEGNEVDYLGAIWTLDYKKFIRAEGALAESVVLKWRVGPSPEKDVIISYVLP